jgi:hypothetical protein
VKSVRSGAKNLEMKIELGRCPDLNEKLHLAIYYND